MFDNLKTVKVKSDFEIALQKEKERVKQEIEDIKTFPFEDGQEIFELIRENDLYQTRLELIDMLETNLERIESFDISNRFYKIEDAKKYLEGKNDNQV